MQILPETLEPIYKLVAMVNTISEKSFTAKKLMRFPIGMVFKGHIQEMREIIDWNFPAFPYTCIDMYCHVFRYYMR